MGKNQNFFREVNIRYCLENDLTVARRVSGGGTVYHGRGNLNFAFIRPHEDNLVNNFREFNRPIIRALKNLGLEAGMNHRSDIVSDGFKISGNAQFTNRRRIISHGTLLLNADLKSLNGSLGENPYDIKTRAISSVRSEVANISELLATSISSEVMTNEIKTELSKEEGLDTLELSNEIIEEVKRLSENKFKTEEWIFQRAANGSINRDGLPKLELKKGIASLPEEGTNGIQIGSLSTLGQIKKPEEGFGLLNKILF